jgi:hypothetical protein
MPPRGALSVSIVPLQTVAELEPSATVTSTLWLPSWSVVVSSVRRALPWLTEALTSGLPSTVIVAV